MRKTIQFLQLAFILLLATACAETSPFKYESVPNDPLKARIYTLDNGLKVNKETPRIQTYIAVRVGGKNDPAETTGLAHYFEHLMFKGTQQFGTQNYEQEKPMLDQIEQLFEVYRKTTDEAERQAIYHQIDSVSYEASKLVQLEQMRIPALTRQSTWKIFLPTRLTTGPRYRRTVLKTM